jgi:hypothetical protein
MRRSRLPPVGVKIITDPTISPPPRPSATTDSKCIKYGGEAWPPLQNVYSSAVVLPEKSVWSYTQTQYSSLATKNRVQRHHTTVPSARYCGSLKPGSGQCLFSGRGSAEAEVASGPTCAAEKTMSMASNANSGLRRLRSFTSTYIPFQTSSSRHVAILQIVIKRPVDLDVLDRVRALPAARLRAGRVNSPRAYLTSREECFRRAADARRNGHKVLFLLSTVYR